MWEDWEKLFKQVAKTSQQVKKALDDFRGPEPHVRIYETDRYVKVVVSPMPEQKVRRWSVKVMGDRVFIRGKYEVETLAKDDLGYEMAELRADEFVKAVRLPVPVEAKPYNSRKEGEVLIATFLKRKELPAGGWFDLP